MIALKNPDGIWLDLDGNTEITFDDESPVFNFEVIPGEKTYLFTIPTTPKNLKALQHPTVIANRTIFNKIIPNYELWLGGQLYAKGNLYVLKTKGNIEVSFQTAVSRIVQEKDNLITSYDFGSYTLPALTGLALENHMLATANGTVDSFDYVFAPIYNSYYLTLSSPQPTIGYVNDFNWNGGFFDVPTSDYPITPFFYIKFVIDKICEVIDLEHIGTFVDDAELKTLALYSPIYANDIDFEPKRFLPEIKVIEFLKELAKLFGITYFFSRTENVISVKTFKEVYKSLEYKDITDKTSPINSIEFTDEKEVKLIMENDSNDDLITEEEYTYTTSDGLYKEIKTKFSLPNMRQHQLGTGSGFLPSTIQNGEYSSTVEKPDFGTRLFFYRGMQNNSAGSPYPYLTTGDTQYPTTPLAGVNYSLAWDGTKGLTNTFLKEYIEFIAKTKIVRVAVQLTLTDILNFDFSETYKIKSDFFLVKKRKFTVGLSGIKNCELELYYKP